MKPVLIINGPNLNMLGKRDPEIYGSETLQDLENLISCKAKEIGATVEFFQSNHEGAIIDVIQTVNDKYSALIINAGAYSHYSYAIRDALEICTVPKFDVHISNIYERDEFRHNDVLKPVCDGQVVGKGFLSYTEALEKAWEMVGDRDE